MRKHLPHEWRRRFRLRTDFFTASEGAGAVVLTDQSLERSAMFTATANLTLPCTVTGSFPRPRWFDVSMWGRPLDTCMLDVHFREKFQDAMAVVISEQERAGLDILSHGD